MKGSRMTRGLAFRVMLPMIRSEREVEDQRPALSDCYPGCLALATKANQSAKKPLKTTKEERERVTTGLTIMGGLIDSTTISNARDKH